VIGRPATPPGRVSPAEAAILTILATGCTQGQVAIRLHLSPSTVDNHLTNARRRCGVATTQALIRHAIGNGQIGGGQ
jgi:DNA-binding CsgD family transcriptional regulator